MIDLFKAKMSQKLYRDKYKINLEGFKCNQVTFGVEILKIYGPKTWNSLQHYIEHSANLEVFTAIKIGIEFCLVFQHALINI